jgi:hypothetical protein
VGKGYRFIGRLFYQGSVLRVSIVSGSKLVFLRVEGLHQDVGFAPIRFLVCKDSTVI